VAQQVSDATPRYRAIADTGVSSCRNASTAQESPGWSASPERPRRSGPRSTSTAGSVPRGSARSACATAPGLAARSTGRRGGPGLANRARRLRHRSRGIP
jgi:hypothetical protein